MTQRKHTYLFVVLGFLTLVLGIADIAVGSVSISLSDTVLSLVGRQENTAIRSIVLDIRVLKTFMAILSGAALSLSGLEMQTLFRNPLAGPYVLGISSGASLGVALLLLGMPLMGIAGASWLRTVGLAGAACIGAGAVLLLVVTLSRRIKDIMVILILGIMLSSGISAVVEILQYLSDEASLKSFVVWTMGSLGDITYPQLYVILPVILIGIALGVAVIKPLNMLLLGEQYASSMGTDIHRTRRLILVSSTVLAGTITAFLGPIGFIGLAAPHIARMIFRSADHRILVPASMTVGMVIMLFCDIVSRLLTLPINTITALTGIPVVIYIVLRNNNLAR